MKALIIAAGKGARLRKWDGDLPKPLYRVAGLPLIERAILSAKKAGITEFVIVTGYRGEVIEKRLGRRAAKLGVLIQFVRNQEWDKANGHSVLKAQPCLNDDFILLMSDHIFDWKILSDLTQQEAGDGVTLAVDRRIDEIFDLDDATKVKTRNGANSEISEIGKEIPEYDAIDTGIFLCSTAIFPALEQACTEGNGSLSEAIRLMAAKGRAKTFAIGKSFWQDVDTPETLKQAEKVLYRSVLKETDGVISRYLNRKISGFMTRWLLKTPFTANQITWSALVIGLLSGYLVAQGTALYVALGGILFQFASIYDGCDGEMAKLKFSSSKFGEWLDTVCDNITYLAFFIGVFMGVFRQGNTHLVPLGIFMAFGVLMALGTMYFYLARYTNSGSLVTVQKDLSRDMEGVEQNTLIYLLGKLKFLIKRDFFALFFMVLCLANQLEWILILTALGSNVAWIVLLTMKREFIAEPKAELSQN